MKLKKIIFSLTVIIMLLSCISFVSAADVSARLTSGTSAVKPGETFTVTLSATCSDGIDTVETAIQYDKDVLELVNGAVSDSSKWINFKENEIIEIFKNGRDNITYGDLYIMTFKVKDNAQLGNTVISAGTITITSKAENNSVSTIDGEAITINISETGALNVGGQATLTDVKIETAPNKTEYSAGEKFSISGMVIKAKYSDGTEKEVTDYKYSPSNDLEVSDKRVTITYTENGVTKTATQNITVTAGDVNKDGEDKKANNTVINNTVKDNTVAKNDIADTGLEDNMGIVFIVLAVIGIASYIQYKRYNNI